MIDFYLEAPHVGIEKRPESAFGEDKKYYYVTFFLPATAGAGHWGAGKVFISSPLFKRKRLLPGSVDILDRYGVREKLKDHTKASYNSLTFEFKVRKSDTKILFN